MTIRPNSKSGGRLSPDGRSPAPKGVGKRSRRHDLERPKTPGLSDSSLQQGDVEALERGQRISPLKKQNQGAAQNRGRKQVLPSRSRGGGNQDTPDPVAFLGDRLSGTLEAAGGEGQQHEQANLLPILEKLATSTGASGLLSQAYITTVAGLKAQSGTVRTPVIDMQDADRDLAALVGQ